MQVVEKIPIDTGTQFTLGLCDDALKEAVSKP
jgi:hypothetical protein